MRILMASGTGRTYSKKSLVQIANLDQLFFRRRYMLGRVAPVARQSGMLPFENVSGLLVIEGLQIPFDQGKIAAVVLGVATRAFLIRGRLRAVTRVQPFARRDSACNLRMAIKTFKNCFAPELVTVRTLCRPLQCLMGA